MKAWLQSLRRKAREDDTDRRKPLESPETGLKISSGIAVGDELGIRLALPFPTPATRFDSMRESMEGDCSCLPFLPTLAATSRLQ